MASTKSPKAKPKPAKSSPPKTQTRAATSAPAKAKPAPAKEHAKSADPLAPPADVATYDREYGQRAFQALEAEIDAVRDEALVSARTDVQRAGLRALALAAAVLEPKANARLRRLPAEEFDMKQVDRLAPLASALIYVHEQAEAAGAFVSEAKIPPDLAKVSAEVEKRMHGRSDSTAHVVDLS
jgi:hypothetical protein